MNNRRLFARRALAAFLSVAMVLVGQPTQAFAQNADIEVLEDDALLDVQQEADLQDPQAEGVLLAQDDSSDEMARMIEAGRDYVDVTLWCDQLGTTWKAYNAHCYTRRNPMEAACPVYFEYFFEPLLGIKYLPYESVIRNKYNLECDTDDVILDSIYGEMWADINAFVDDTEFDILVEEGGEWNRYHIRAHIDGYPGAVDLRNAVVTLSSDSYEYTGDTVYPVVTSVTLDGEELDPELYELSYSAYRSGNGFVTVKPKKETHAYKAVSRSVGYTITQKPLNFIWEGVDSSPVDFAFAYDGDPKTPNFSLDSQVVATRDWDALTEGTFELAYAKVGTDEWTRDAPTEPGSYVAKVVATDIVEHFYNYSSPEYNYGSLRYDLITQCYNKDVPSSTRAFHILAAGEKADIDPSVSIDSWLEGDAPSEPVVTGNAGGGAVRFEYAVEGSDAWSEDVPTTEGRYVVRATIEATEKYNGASCEASFEIKNGIIWVAQEGWTFGDEPASPCAQLNGEDITDRSTFEYRAAGEGDDAWTSEVPVNAGSYAVRAKAGTHTSYPTAFSIAPREVVVSVKDAHKTYGADDPEFEAKVTGLVEGWGVTYSFQRDNGEDVGAYEVRAVGEARQAQGNYAVTFRSGTLTVDRKQVSIVVSGASKTYGASDPEFTARVTGTLNGDHISYSLAREEGEAPGTYCVYVVGSDDDPNEQASLDRLQRNYEIVRTTPATLAIGAATATVTPKDVAITYGEEVPTLKWTAEGIMGNDAVDASFVVAHGSDDLSSSGHLKVGTYDIVVSEDTKAEQGGYALRFGSATLTVRPRTVSPAGIVAKNKTYDGTREAELDLSGAQLVGSVDGDDLSFSAQGTFANKNAGSKKKVTLSQYELDGQDADNYVIKKPQASCTATISRATLTVTAKNKTIAFGKDASAPGVTYAGFVDNETSRVLRGTVLYGFGGYAKGSYAGTYSITPSGLTSDNYKIVYKKGKLTVTAPQRTSTGCTVSVSGIGELDTVYGGEPAGTVGQSRRMESMKLALSNQPFAGGIKYRAHVQGKGWEKSWSLDGQMCGTMGESRRLEAIQVRLYGRMAKEYDVYYRLHVQTLGWMSWAKNGEKAGTQGMSKRVEGIQVVLVKKGANPLGRTFKGVTQTYGKCFQAK